MNDLRAAVMACGAALPLMLALPVVGGEAAVEAATLDEIVVTATKREESLQRVPVSVDVVTGDQLAQAAVVRLQDLESPSLTVKESAIGNNLYVRGIGSGVNPGFEQSVGTYVDGLYRGRGQLSRAPLLDVARIEILRGPQTLLFGKNSIAGAVNVISNRSTADLQGYLQSTYDFNLKETEFEGALSGPISPRIRGRLSARSAQADGYLKNLLLGTTEPEHTDTAFRGQLAFDVTDNFTATLKAENSDFNNNGRDIEVYAERPATAGPFTGLVFSQILSALGAGSTVLNNTLDYKRSANGDFSRNHSEELGLTLDWKLGEHLLTWQSGHSSYRTNELCDCDFTGANVFSVSLQERFQQTSHELRMTSPPGKTLDYILGAYYETTGLDYGDSIQVNSTSILVPVINSRSPGAGSAIANTGTPRVFSQSSNAFSGYASLTWNAQPNLRVNGGLRYFHEVKDATRSLVVTALDGSPLAGAQAVIAPAVYASVFNVRGHSLSGSHSSSRVMPSLGLQFDLRDGVMGYVTAVRGYKSGGFDARSNNPTAPPALVCTGTNVSAGCIPAASVGSFEFDDEQSTSYEAGLKSRFADGRAELNLAVYHNDFKNLQVSTFDGVLGFNVSNAGAARVNGVELNGRMQAGNHLQLRGSTAWTEFKYTQFYGQCYTGLAPNAPDGRNCNYAGKGNTFAPDIAGSLSAEYNMPVGARLQLAASVEAVYSGSYFSQPSLDPATVQGSYTKFNARIGLSADNHKWEVAVLGRNLTDKLVVGYSNDIPLAARTFGAPSYGGFVEAPRSVAIQGSVRF